jgi:hypothetical protein
MNVFYDAGSMQSLWRHFGVIDSIHRSLNQLLHWQVMVWRLHSFVTGEARAGAAGE